MPWLADGPAARRRGGHFPYRLPAPAAMVLIPGLMSSGDVWNVVEHYASRYQLHVLTIAAAVPLWKARCWHRSATT